MNIVVKTASGRIITRPSTTLEKNNSDLYVPDFVDSLSYTPVMFARICGSARSIGVKFAGRYYDSINYGVLLYPDNLLQGKEGFACASCLDHTSFLPAPLYNTVTVGVEGNEFILSKKKNSRRKIFAFGPGELKTIDEAIAEASRYVFLRTGDLLAVELQGRKPLMKRADGKMNLKATYCGNTLMDFDIIM